MMLRDAIYMLENKGLIVQTEGFGKVVSQSLLPGYKINKNDIIKIELN